jgi:hypothetical protein
MLLAQICNLCQGLDRCFWMVMILMLLAQICNLCQRSGYCFWMVMLLMLLAQICNLCQRLEHLFLMALIANQRQRSRGMSAPAVWWDNSASDLEGNQRQRSWFPSLEGLGVGLDETLAQKNRAPCGAPLWFFIGQAADYLVAGSHHSLVAALSGPPSLVIASSTAAWFVANSLGTKPTLRMM